MSVPLNDGTSIPLIAFGSGTALYGKDAAKSVANAIAAGFRHIDAAQMYRNEESVGEGIRQSSIPRSEVYITTKLGQLSEGQTVQETLKESLQKLQTDHVDLFLIHNPKDHADIKAVWKQLEAARAEGLTKSIGVSNFQPKHLQEILEVATVPPAVNQIEYHPYVFKASQGIIDTEKSHGIVTTSYGGLTPIVRASGKGIEPVLDKIARRISRDAGGQTVTQGQILQLWLQKKGIPAITTSSKQERLKEYLAVATLPALSDEEEAEIDAAGSKVHFRNFMKWIDAE